jgi:hypothetical protein
MRSIGPATATPALLQSTWILPKRWAVASAARHVVAIGDVDGEREHFGRDLAQRGRGTFERRSLDVGNRDLHAGLREAARHREPDAARAARDEGRPADDVSHSSTPCPVRRTRWDGPRKLWHSSCHKRNRGRTLATARKENSDG